YPFVPKMLLYFERYFRGHALNCAFTGESVVDSRERSRKFDVHDRTEDLYNLACIHICIQSPRSEIHFIPSYSACPPAISSSSFVILPCRSLLYSSLKSLTRFSALSVAFFIDTMRALCSLALAFSNT